jgi:Ser/Thr protein kinase RdoA (MazF antagonist)
MTNALFSALRDLGIDEVHGRDAWRRLVVVRNFTEVPPRSSLTPMGFKFVVHDGHGAPRWFGRCGWDTSAAMRAECALLAALGRDPVTAQHVPESRAAEVGDTMVHVSRHLGPVAYDRHLSTRTAHEWAAETDEILRLSERMMVHVTNAAPPVFTYDPHERREAQLEQDLLLLQQSGLDAHLVQWFRTNLSPSLRQLPAVLQHGDLWPANVLRAENRWWLIDFSECGIMWIPGYDLFLLLVNGPAGFDTSWIAPAPVASRDQWNLARWSTIAAFARRHAFSSHTMGELLLHFLIRLTAHRMRPGLSRELSRHWREELTRIGTFLARTSTFDHVFKPI